MTDAADSLGEREAGTRPRVLMVDDSKVMRKSAVKMLGGDFDVIVAEDGAEGWEMIQQDAQIQVVFTDLSMPKITGYELLRLVRTSENELIRGLPVIVVTGAENDDDAKEQALAAGATDFITKPFNSTDLKARALAHASHQRTTKVLQQNANVDVLTGLPNQRALLERVEKDVSFIARHQEDIAILIVEVDAFNDLFTKIGRAGADSVIKQIAKVLEKCVRQEDTVARIGLARFALSLPTARSEGAMTIAQRVCRTVESFKARLRGEPILISVSIGIHSGVRGGKVASGTLLGHAERALVQAQARGRSQIDVTYGTVADLQSESSAEGRGQGIEALLAQLARGEGAEGEMDAVLEALEPLWSYLDESRRQRLVARLSVT